MCKPASKACVDRPEGCGSGSGCRAVQEFRRVLKPDGILIVSGQQNFGLNSELGSLASEPYS